MGASGAYLDVELCSAWRLAPGKGGSRGVQLFWLWTPKPLLLPKYLTDSDQTWYEASGQRGLVNLCSLSKSAFLKRLGEKLIPKSGIIVEIIILANLHWPNTLS